MDSDRDFLRETQHEFHKTMQLARPTMHPFKELLAKTADHDIELEKLKLQKLRDDILKGKHLMVLRVIGLSRIAPKYKYFEELYKNNKK